MRQIPATAFTGPPFPGKIWVLLAITLAVFSVLFATFHKAYSHLDVGMVTPEPLRANFFIYTFCKITEPEPLPWFHGKAVGGKIGVSSWTLFTLLMLMFYQSNLRAHMITVTYGKPIDTLQDVLGHGRRVWTVNSPTLRQKKISSFSCCRRDESLSVFLCVFTTNGTENTKIILQP